MPLYMYQAAYSSEALAAQIKDPKDRIEVVGPMFEGVGGKILVAGFSFGEYDVVAIYEAPDDTTAASLALAIGASGALKSGKTTRLLSSQEWVAALRKAQTVAPTYKPPR